MVEWRLNYAGTRLIVSRGAHLVPRSLSGNER